MELIDKIKETTSFLKLKGCDYVDIAIVTGTGLSNLEDLLIEKVELDYSDLPHFPISTVEGHNSKLIFGSYAGKSILIYSGRFHYYEGYEMSDVTYYVYVTKQLGAKELIITNASGGVAQNLKEGEIVLIKDHINMFPSNPLRGNMDARLGERFPDMLLAYPWIQRDKVKSIFPKIKECIYLGWPGPSLETQAEYRMCGLLGADIVGMSTVPEVIVAKFLKLPIVVFSVVSNVVDQENLVEANIQNILDVMKKSGDVLKEMLKKYLEINEDH
jgi:purine-nucleoside phosphorylase